MNIFEDCYHNANFNEEELTHLRELTLKGLSHRIDSPAALCFDLFSKTLWEEHPYRRDPNGDIRTIENINQAAVQEYWQQKYLGQKPVVTVVGDVSVDQAAEWGERIFAHKQYQTTEEIKPFPREEPPKEARIARYDLEKEQTHLLIGTQGITIDDDDRDALELVIDVLSGQGGRFFLELRDRQSLCYSVSAFHIPGLDPGFWGVYMGTSPEKVDQGLHGIETIIQDIVAHGVTDAELSKAQKHLTGLHAISLQRLSAQGAMMGFNELYDLGFDV